MLADSIKVNLVHNKWATVTVEFVVVENSYTLYQFIWIHRGKCFRGCKLVDFFPSPANTKVQLHLITGAQILFYESQIMKLRRSHFCYSFWCKYGAQLSYTRVSNNVKSLTEFAHLQNRYVNSCNESFKHVKYFLFLDIFLVQIQVHNYKCLIYTLGKQNSSDINKWLNTGEPIPQIKTLLFTYIWRGRDIP